MRLVVLASGRGSNLQAIVNAIESGALHAELVAVFSDKRDANALNIARHAGAQAVFVDPKGFTDRVAFDKAMFNEIERLDPDLIVLAGFMRVLSADVVERNAHRIINIHPSLLPKHKGLHTHRKVLEQGDTEHGASVHLVTAELDGGPVLAHARVCVLPDDTEETLAARVLSVEHPLLVACLNEWQRGHFSYAAPQVLYRGDVLQCPLEYQADPAAVVPLT